MTPLALRIASTYCAAKKHPLLELVQDEAPHVLEDLERVSRGGITFGPLRVGDWKQGEITLYRDAYVPMVNASWKQTFSGASQTKWILVEIAAYVRSTDEPDQLTVSWGVRSDDGEQPGSGARNMDTTVSLARGLEPPRAILQWTQELAEKFKHMLAAGLR